jgi:hypothetical protein
MSRALLVRSVELRSPTVCLCVVSHTSALHWQAVTAPSFVSDLSFFRVKKETRICQTTPCCQSKAGLVRRAQYSPWGHEWGHDVPKWDACANFSACGGRVVRWLWPTAGWRRSGLLPGVAITTARLGQSWADRPSMLGARGFPAHDPLVHGFTFYRLCVTVAPRIFRAVDALTCSPRQSLTPLESRVMGSLPSCRRLLLPGHPRSAASNW